MASCRGCSVRSSAGYAREQSIRSSRKLFSRSSDVMAHICLLHASYRSCDALYRVDAYGEGRRGAVRCRYRAVCAFWRDVRRQSVQTA